jgi:hypothetical protein
MVFSHASRSVEVAVTAMALVSSIIMPASEHSMATRSPKSVLMCDSPGAISPGVDVKSTVACAVLKSRLILNADWTSYSIGAEMHL